MNNDIFEKYKNEMLKMYEQSKKNSAYEKSNAAETVALPETEEKVGQNSDASENEMPKEPTTPNPIKTPLNNQTGGLLGIVTSFRNLYPVENAKVTIFTGDADNKNVIDSDLTDRSGRTKVFTLPAPDKSLSMSPDLSETPYASYNMEVESDGFLKNIHLNIPVFSGITSIQRSDLILSEDRIDKTPQVFDESQKYNL